MKRSVLENLARDLADAEARLAACQVDVERAEARAEAADRECAAVESIRPALPPVRPALVEEARAAEETARAALRRAEDAQGAEAATTATLQERLERVRIALDPTVVDRFVEATVAFEAYRDAWDAGGPDPIAQSLAAEWEEINRREAARPAPPSDEEVTAAETDLTLARQRLVRIEEQIERPAARAAIEAARAEVQAAEAAASGRFGVRGRDRLRDAQRRLSEALAKAGYESYLEYMVSDHLEAPRADLVDKARVAVAEAEARLGDLLALQHQARTDQDAADRQRVVGRAAELLGFVPASPQVLRGARMVPHELTTKLLRVMGGSADPNQPLLETAQAWLAGLEAAATEAESAASLSAALEADMAARSTDGFWPELTAAARALVDLAVARREAAEAVGLAPDDAAARATAIEAWQRYQAVAIGERDAARAAVDAARDARRAADRGVEEVEDAIDPLLGPDWTPADLASALAEEAD